MQRCPWSESNEKMQAYHDEVWGVPEFGDQQLFRKLVLDMNQAGLSWNTILNKMENFDVAYEGFAIGTVAAFDEEKVETLMQDSGIIRNRRKIEAAITNAQCVLEIQKEFGSFSDYLWKFVDFQPIENQFSTVTEVPTKTPLSDEISKDLKKRGFKFVGTTIIYAFMEAVGMVNDHLLTCPCHEKVKETRVTKKEENHA